MTMADTTSDLTEKLLNIAGKWTTYAGFGTFLLYLFGYLTLRFQLNTYGVVTNLDVFDEKYLLAGCRFLVYLCTTVPILLFFLALIALLLALPLRLMPRSIWEKTGESVGGWLTKPYRLPILGCAVALLMIQLLLRQCLFLNNLLLAGCLPPGWISSLFMAGDAAQTFYFSGLLAGIGLTGALLVYSLRQLTGARARWLNALLVMLFAIECLLLPVNFGMLIASRWLPRVSDVHLADNSPENGTAWLVFENKEVLTYLVRDKNNVRKLITVPRKDSQITIIGNDPIFQIIFAGHPSCP